MTDQNDPKQEGENQNLNKEIEHDSSAKSKIQEEGEAQRLLKEEKQVQKAQKVVIYRKISQSISYLVAALEILLGLRFFLQLTGANQENIFASLIYRLSKPFVVPFSNLFNDIAFNEGGNVFEINVLFAMLIYLLLMVLVKWLIDIIAIR